MSDIKRTHRQKVAAETLQILKDKQYLNAKGEMIDISKEIDYSIEHSMHYRPEDFAALRTKYNTTHKTRIEVTNETTLACAKRLWDSGQKDICALNFASAKNAGGGFINGSQAQEESIARASALYLTQIKHETFYTTHRNLATKLYTDNMIYSPKVPIFRDDENMLLDAPYLLSVITSPAVNKGALDKKDMPSIKSVSLARIEKIIALAVYYKHPILILGAWGCGVFQNDPKDMAQYFYQKLVKEKIMEGCFEKIIFAVYDNSKFKQHLRLLAINVKYASWLPPSSTTSIPYYFAQQ